MQPLNDTAHKLLDVAERYTQTRGFNAFSYKDLQNEVGVKTSSIHYYFPTKQDLAVSMTDRYVERFVQRLAAFAEENGSGSGRLQLLGENYIAILGEGKFCLCGMLASDLLALPEVVNLRLAEFFSLVEAWIAEAIELGKTQQEFRPSINSGIAAAHYLATLEGGMLIARTRQQTDYLEVVLSDALEQLKI